MSRRLGGGKVGLIGLVAALAALGGLATGCTKDKESLILVDLHATDANGGSIVKIQINVAKPSPSTEIVASPSFDKLDAGLPMSPVIELGVYIPAGVTGALPITVVAKQATGCMGYVGSGMASVTAGGTATVSITMMASSDVCGGGGSCGTVVGTKPATVAPPTLTSCIEYDSQMGLTCDPAGGTNNPWINMVAVSPDGTLLATASEDSYFHGSVKIWRLQGNTPTPCGPVFDGTDLGPGYVAFSPNGQLFAFAWNQDYIYVYSVPSFVYMGTIKSSPNPLYGVGFSADSQTVLSVDWDQVSDGTLYADQPNGTPVTSTMLGVDPDAMAVSPVAVGGGTAIVVPGFNGNFAYHTWTGSAFAPRVVMATVATQAGTRAGFSPNGMLMAEGTQDGAVRFWSLPVTAASVPVGSNIVLNDVPLAISFSPASDNVAFAYGTSFDIWSVGSRALVSRHTVTGTFADSVTFSASGGAIVGGEDVCGKFLVCGN